MQEETHSHTTEEGRSPPGRKSIDEDDAGTQERLPQPVGPSNQVRARNAKCSIQQTDVVKVMNAPANVDDDDVVLQPEEQNVLKEFREQLLLCKDDDEKFEACTQWRDNVLQQHTKLQILCYGLAQIERTQARSE